MQVDVTSGIALVFVLNPDWLGGGDMDGPMAVATRRKLYDMLAVEKMPMIGYHLPFPAIGRIEKSGSGRTRTVQTGSRSRHRRSRPHACGR